MRLDKLIWRYQLSQGRYEQVAAMRRRGMPPFIIYGIHYREGDNSFRTHLANGDSLSHRTVHEPKGRIPSVPPPYSWEQGAEDALYVDRHDDRVNWHSLTDTLHEIESFNGFGYRARGMPSPYLWSGTTAYERGKFTSDHHFDPLAVDSQLGVVAILKRMQDRGIKFPF